MAAKALAKPQLRGLLHSSIKRNLTMAILLSITSGIAFRILYCNKRKQTYAEFYKNYDPEVHFERMRKAGVFQSCPP